jgi:hypothetical protein
MLVGYMRVSSDSDRQTTHLQRDALLAAGIDSRHLFEDHATSLIISGSRVDDVGGYRAAAAIAALEAHNVGVAAISAWV